MKKREAKHNTLFNKYLRKSGMQGYFELKQTKGNSIRWSCVEPHQMAGLLAAEQGGFIWKLSDEDQRRKPFDCFSAPPLKSYVVIFFPKAFHIILAVKFFKERGATDEPSLTRDVSFRLAERVINIP